MKSWHLPHVDATRELGRCIASQLRRGDIVAIDGDLGAGKTTLVRAMAECMGADPKEIGSPSFGLVHEYALGQVGRIIHLDAYRLSGPEDLLPLGWSDWMLEQDCVVVIEWARRVDPLPSQLPTVRISMWHVAQGRDVEVCWADDQRGAGMPPPASGESP